MFKFLSNIIKRTNDDLYCVFLLALVLTAFIITVLLIECERTTIKRGVFSLTLNAIGIIICTIYYKEIQKESKKNK